MAQVKKEIRSVLLLSPYKLLQDQRVLEILVIDKSAAKSPFTNKPINSSELKTWFPDMSKPCKDVLTWFNAEGIEFTRDEIRKKYAKQKAGIAFGDYYLSSMMRHMLELFERLKPFAQTMRWYHKIPVDHIRFTTGACSISRYKPAIQFLLTGTADNIELQTWVNVNGSLTPLSDFRRYEFLLESRNEYYLISYADAQTLNWLEKANTFQYAGNPQALVTNVLTRLEESYKVDRAGLIEMEAIDVLPINRVMLSEISNSFLMITPQWVYEGFVIEDKWRETEKITRNGVEYLINRNKEAEDKFRLFLESLHSSFSRQLNGYYYLSFADAQKAQWFPKTYHTLLSENIEVTGMDMLKHFRYSAFPLSSEVKYTGEEAHMVVLHMKLNFGKEQIPLREMQKMLLAGQRVVILKDGSLGLLPDEWLAKYSGIIKLGKIKDDKIHVPRWLAFSDEENTELAPVIKNDWLSKWRQWQQSDSIVYQPDPLVNASLRPYQQKGFEWMMLLAEAGAGACLADDMGLGKTLQSICFLSARLVLNKNSRHLIVCPSSLMYNWKQEFEKFAPHIVVRVHHGASRSSETISDSNIQVIITSYGTVRSDFPLLSAASFETILLDESHNIKNPAAQITKLVNQLRGEIRIALSGTPVMNNTFDLYAQLDFLLPGIFGSREYFKREFADPIDRDN
ncbi:MAG: ATP-dependent helicase, partial [Chitinophagaceae bacterium]